MMRKFFKNRRGETLIETIIALSVLAIGITIASSSIINSIRNMSNAKNRVIAVNIAREGIEDMHNIRDTNWLLYSDRRRECWNHDPSIIPCEGLEPIPPGNYVIYRSAENNWKLKLSDDFALTPLSFVDIDLTVDSNADDTVDNDANIYNHVTGIDDTYGPETQKTPFRRYLTIEYLDDDGSFEAVSKIDEPFDSINTMEEWKTLGDEDIKRLNRMRLTSTVEWTQSGAIHKAELKTILTDHLGRTELES